MTVPVTVLGGFLGAGKTTALNALLRRATRRIAVLVNDFGAINVDAALVTARGAGTVALSNGCVCCALGPDLGEGIARLAALRPDQIVVEASGVSDPWRIAQLVRLEEGVALDAVPVLVDAARFPALLADRWLADTLLRQVARADMVLLTHMDSASSGEAAATRRVLADMRPDLPVAALGDELSELLGFVHGAPERFAAEAVHDFRTWHWTPGPFDRVRLAAVLDALPDSVLRLKGFCRVDGARHVLQRSGRRWTLEPWDQPADAALVAIGTPDMPDLTARFGSALQA